MKRIARLSLSLVLGAVAVVGVLATTRASAASASEVVMSGLHNPRGLAFGPQGALYVAEAGQGGLGLHDPFCFTGEDGRQRCYGATGSVSRLWHGIQERVATGLPSQARADNGNAAIGPNDIAMLGVGSAYVTIGLMQHPRLRDDNPELNGLARLARIEPTGAWGFVADLGAYEEVNNPDAALYSPFPGGGQPDTNPYGLLAQPGRVIVTDAGGNDVLQVGATGDISTLAVIPPVLAAGDGSSVPTSIAVGPDGAYYVGELTGAPFAEGAANVYRIGRAETSQSLHLDDACLGGFKTIIDLAFDPEGNLYVLQYTSGPLFTGSTGVLIRVTPDKSAPGGICAQYRAGVHTQIVDGLSQPTSIAVGPDGALYISNHGSSATGGEVLRVEP